MNAQITVKLNGKTMTVDRAEYIKAKTKQLRDFGYSDLTKETVGQQLNAILSGGKLDVIGMFMQDDIVIK